MMPPEITPADVELSKDAAALMIACAERDVIATAEIVDRHIENPWKLFSAVLGASRAAICYLGGFEDADYLDFLRGALLGIAADEAGLL